MSLIELPVEILGTICRFMGLDRTSMFEGKPLIRYKNEDFQSLRLTCRELYRKTGFDAGMRYSLLLEELEIYLEQKSFALFLHIAKNPDFRDHIHTIYIYAPSGEDPKDTERHYQTTDAEVLAEIQALNGFCASKAAIELLAECFENLKDAKNLRHVQLNSDHGHSLVLDALRHTCIPGKLAYLAVEPNRLARSGYGPLSSAPKDYSPYVKGLEVRTNLMEERSSSPMTPEEREDNLSGLHIKHYKPTRPEFTELMSALCDIESLEYSGCRAYPNLRLCHGCDDLFAKTIAPILFPSLSSFTICGTLVSGSRLRRFIKRHAGTLVEVRMYFATLTDGCWRSIAQGLVKLPQLRKLEFQSLRQKRPANSHTTNSARPAHYAATDKVILEEAVHVQCFLKIFITSFSTVLYANPSRFTWCRPKYFEARLFQLPYLAVSTNGMKSLAKLRTYAEME